MAEIFRPRRTSTGPLGRIPVTGPLSSGLCILIVILAVWAGTAFGQTAVGTPPRDPRLPGQAATATPSGTASVVGLVTIAGSGQPARRARVTLSGNEMRSLSRTTDSQGRFAFVALPAGRYTLTASKSGYVNAVFGQHRPGSGRSGTPIQLADGQRFEARLQLPRGAAITGTVLDENAEPTPGIQVRAMRWSTLSGQRLLQQAGGGATDDRGIYRIFNLQPGEYVVCAAPRNQGFDDALRMDIEMEATRRAADAAGRDPAQMRALADRMAAFQAQAAAQPEEQPSGYASICFPGTPSAAAAAAVAIGVSEERTGVDFQLQLAPLARIEGTVVNATGAQIQGLQVTMTAAGDVPGETRSARADAEGRFRFAGIAPGQYTLTARAMVNVPRTGPPAGSAQDKMAEARAMAEPQRLWAATDLSVDGRNVANVVLQLHPGMSISGQITFDGAQQQPVDLSRMRVNATPMPSGPIREFMSTSQGRVDASGRFTVTNVQPGRYRLSASGAGTGWFVESAIAGGQDSLDVPVEVKPHQNITGAVITMTDRQAEFSGSLVNERNEPATAYTVILFAADARFWHPLSRRIQTARPATDGRFSFRGLPPGDYRLATVLDPEPGSWYDPAYLQQLHRSSTAVTLAAGEKKTQDVRISTQ